MASSFDELFDKNKEKMKKSSSSNNDYDDLDDFMMSERQERRKNNRDRYEDYDDYEYERRHNRRREMYDDGLDENGFPIERGSRRRMGYIDDRYDDYDRYDRYDRHYDDYDRYDRRDRPVIIDKSSRGRHDRYDRYGNRYDRHHTRNDIEVYRNEDNYIAHNQIGRGSKSSSVSSSGGRRTYYADGTYYDDIKGSGRWLEEGQTDDIGKIIKIATWIVFGLAALFALGSALLSSYTLGTLAIINFFGGFAILIGDNARKSAMAKKIEMKQRRM